jgi:AraC-like DNA-binding protein
MYKPTSASVHLQESALTDTVDGNRERRKIYSDAYGMNFEFEAGGCIGTSTKSWLLGELDFIMLDVAHLSLPPPPDHLEDYMFLKMVKAGSLMVQLQERTRRFDAGSILIADTASRYKQQFEPHMELMSLKFPKRLLAQRGLRAGLRGLLAPDMVTADARAIADLLLIVASQNGATSDAMRERQAEHLLDLVSLIVADPNALVRSCSRDVLLSRTKSYIARNLHNVELDVRTIATSLGVSSAHLHRVLRTYDISLMRYVWTCRLERAAELLARQYSSKVTIGEISYRCGFENPAHFSRAFRERFGLSPREAVARSLCGDIQDQAGVAGMENA